jgi:hypothetical protein
MKKIVVLIVAALLVFSFTGFSPDKPHKKTMSARIENSRKKNAAGSIKPRKSKSRKHLHKSKIKRSSPKSPKNNLRL